MFTEQEKNYYKQIKASDSLRTRIHNIEVEEKPNLFNFNYRLVLTFSMCFVLAFFSLNLFNQDLNLSIDGLKLNEEAQVIGNNPVVMYRRNDADIKIKTNRDVTIDSCDGIANYEKNLITWLIEEANEDATYSLNLSYDKQSYQILLMFNTEMDAYTMSVHKLEKGEQQ